MVKRFYPEVDFGGYTHVDGTVDFYLRVRSVIDASKVVLDVGCGRGRYEDDEVPVRRDLRVLKGHAGHVIGIDVDAAAANNPHIDEFRRLDPGGRWPIEDGSIDVALSDFVLEHVEHPEHFFSELSRVLRPGGVFCARAPNRRSYVALLARVVPNNLHARVVGSAQDGRKPEDVFPTFYRCNTKRQLRRMCEKNGLTAWIATLTGEPSYLGFNAIAYRLGVLHQKLTPQAFGMALVVFARKQVDHPDRMISTSGQHLQRSALSSSPVSRLMTGIRSSPAVLAYRFGSGAARHWTEAE